MPNKANEKLRWMSEAELIDKLKKMAGDSTLRTLNVNVTGVEETVEAYRTMTIEEREQVKHAQEEIDNAEQGQGRTQGGD